MGGGDGGDSDGVCRCIVFVRLCVSISPILLYCKVKRLYST